MRNDRSNEIINNILKLRLDIAVIDTKLGQAFREIGKYLSEKQTSNKKENLDMDKLRKCKGRYYFQGHYHDFELGYFHKWGSNYVEFENGAGNFSVAIVELPDGRIIMPSADGIVFLDLIEM